MTKKSPEFFRDEYLPMLARTVSYVQTARALGISEGAVYVWLRESRAAMKRGEEASEYFFLYDGEERWFHQHVKAAQKASISDVEANARARARDGYFRPCRFQGKTVWREDPRLVGLDDRTLDMLGYPDRLLRVNGELQPELEWIAPSTDLVIAILQSNSETYRRRSSVDVNMNARIGGSAVLTLGGPKQPPQIAAPLPVLEIVQEAEQEPVLTDDEPSLEVTDTDPDAAGPGTAPTPAPAPEPVDPGPRITTPTPPEYAPGLDPILRPRVTGRPLSDLERDLLSKLPSSLNRR
jgi:hypothetical protein